MKSYLLIIITLLAASGAQAGIINVLGEANEDKMGISGKAAFALEWSTGSVDEMAIEAEMITRYRWPEKLAFLVLKGEYGAESGEAHAKSTFEHLRYRQSMGKRLALEAFLQHESDPFRRLALRALAGAGPRLKLLGWTDGSLHFGTAYMSELEHLNELSGAADSGAEFYRHRWSNYLSLQTALTKRTAFGQTIFAQPRFDDFASIRYFSETSFGFEIEDRIGLSILFVMRYDTQPYEQVPDLDTELKTELEWVF